MASNLIPQEIIEQKIYLIRGHKVMLSNHLAILYQVEAKRLIQAVKRNKGRFPEDFMFQLTVEETRFLRSQFVTLENHFPKTREKQKIILLQREIGRGINSVKMSEDEFGKRVDIKDPFVFGVLQGKTIKLA